MPILDFCRQRRKTKIGWFEAEHLAVTGEKNFDYQKEPFLEPIKKVLILLITGEPVSANVYSTILVITKIYIFLLLYFTSVLLLIVQSQPFSFAWTVTSTAAIYHCWSYMEHSDLWIRCVACIWYWHSLSLWDMRIYLIFDLINVNDNASMHA